MRPPLFATALVLCLSAAATAQSGQLEETNLGVLKPNTFTGHVLTPPAPAAAKALAPARILYAPADNDDPAYRAQIAAAAGGATVDYFDARNFTPDSVLLATYDAVHTFADFGYADKVGMGDNLATFVDQGGHVILGVFTTGWGGKHWLEGAIMGPGYSPVASPTGLNHYTGSPYLGNGSSCVATGVTTLDITYRDTLVPQGSGVVDGHFADGEIAIAYRPLQGNAGSVVFVNGCGAFQFSGTGDWATAVGNAAVCLPGVTFGTCTTRLGVMGLNPGGFDCTTGPSSGLTWSAQVDTTPLVGTTTILTMVVSGFGGATDNVPLLGYELLCLPPFLIDTANGAHAIAVPAGLSGLTVATQAARLEVDALGNPIVVLLNGQDLTIG
ncbi:MAG: hypothetical protein P1V81_04905 [Planctomycetota bacterium]|nr:hypothetical protein [Planctomycetota bacterium]